MSASMVDVGYDSIYGKEAGYGAYRGIVLAPDGTPLRTPDRISPGDEYLIPIGSTARRPTTESRQSSSPRSTLPPAGQALARPSAIEPERRPSERAGSGGRGGVEPRRSPPLPRPQSRAIDNPMRFSRATAEPRALDPPLRMFTSGKATSKCRTPYPLSGPDRADAFGVIAHALIQNDYVKSLGLKRGRSVQIDDSFRGRQNKAFTNFLINKNLRTITPEQKAAIRAYRGQRPDIVLDNGVERGFEEIKSAHKSTIDKGVEQVEAISRFMKDNGLPYTFGTSYEPKEEIPIVDFFVLGEVVEVYLSCKREKGLIAYHYCLRADWDRLKGKFRIVIDTLIVIIAVLLALAWEGPLPPIKAPGRPPQLPDLLPVIPPIEVIIPPDKQPLGIGRVSALLVPETMTALRKLPRDLIRSASAETDIVMEPYVER